MAREWHQTKADRWSLRYRDEIIDTFEKDIFPYIGKRPIADIKPMELLEALRKMEKRGALEKMRKVRQRCGEVFRFAIITGRANYNPAPDLASALATPKRYIFLSLLPMNYLTFSTIWRVIPAVLSRRPPLRSLC